jgi:hypothetical protein
MPIYKPFWPSGPEYSDLIQPKRGPLAPFGFLAHLLHFVRGRVR